MDADATHIIDSLGGTSEVAKLVRTAPSTVHSWRKGIPESRLDHIELAAIARGKADELAKAKDTLPSRIAPQLDLGATSNVEAPAP